jgi:protein-S-isoprenylcysteine O-methyltransferase Ste14
MIKAVIDQWLNLLAGQWEYVVLFIAGSSIVSGVVVSFAMKRAVPHKPATKESVPVATVTMALFFVIAFVVGRLELGQIELPAATATVLKVAGSVLVIYASAINIAGRVALGHYWSDQIEISTDHRLVRSWPYNWSRHPLYGSMILFGVGMGLLMLNPIVVGAVLGIFVPAMRYRSVREEALLLDALGETYRAYQGEIRMLMPLPGKRRTQ